MLDKKSLKILKILQEKARIPNTEVSRQVGLAPSAVLERIRKMETQGIIDGYEVRLNPERFFRNQVAFINVECDSTADADGEIGRTLAEIDEIQEVHYIAGEDCYLIKLRVSDTRELGNFLRRAIYPIQGIRSIRSSVVMETFKETARISIR